MLAVCARASANLNDQSERKFNVVATRKLPVYQGGSWTAVQATRNPIWALCDVMRSSYGAYLPDNYLDLDSLSTMAGELETDQKWFDWTFDSKSTIWEAQNNRT